MANPRMVPMRPLKQTSELQMRVEFNPKLQGEYLEAMKAGDQFPAIVVFDDGQKMWIADGHHRFRAALQLNAEYILADVRKGTFSDALRFSLSANDTNGLRRSREDKRKAVMTALTYPDWAGMSNREIARWCNVSHTYVSDVRTELRRQAHGIIPAEKPKISKCGSQRKTRASVLVGNPPTIRDPIQLLDFLRRTFLCLASMNAKVKGVGPIKAAIDAIELSGLLPQATTSDKAKV